MSVVRRDPLLLQLSVLLCAVALFLASCAPQAMNGAEELGSGCTSSDQLVDVPDPALHRAVTRNGSPAPGKASCAQLARLRNFTVRGADNLEGLQYAANLQSLTLQDSSISTLAPLTGLSRLATLQIRGSELSSLDTLPRLARLSRLEVTDSPVSDISGLRNAPSLTFVTVHSGMVSDISVLAELSDLYWLDLEGNRVGELSSLSGLSKLSVVQLDDAGVSELGDLHDLPAVRWLELADNEISDASALAGLPSLSRLSLAGNRVTDISFVTGLGFELLDLRDNLIEDASPLFWSLRRRADGRYLLSGNCIDLGADDPFLTDLLSSDADLELAPQRQCSDA